MKYFIRPRNGLEVLGPFTMRELIARLASGTVNQDWEASGDAGQGHERTGSAPNSGARWVPILELEDLKGSPADRVSSPPSACRSESAATPSPSQPEALAWFSRMVDHCYDYAAAAHQRGQTIVGIMCEFTPREILLAAGVVPVCLCGGSAETVAAAERCLPSNLCPLIKSTFGYHLQRTNPFLEWASAVVAETTCDGKKKMFELMAESREMYVLELPHRSGSPEALEYWTGEVRRFKEWAEARFKTSVTDDKLREAIRLMNRERRLRRALANLMTRHPPPLTGRQLLEFKSIISGIPADLEQYEAALRWYESVPSPAPSNGPSPVRVLLTGVPLVHGAERVLELIESCGAVVVCQENCTGLKPLLEDVDPDAADPVQAIAAKYYHLPCSVMTANDARRKTLRELAARFRPECVIELVWQACLTYDVESWHVRKLAEEDLRLPYLKITTDYSPSDSARISARIEALFELIRGRRSVVSPAPATCARSP